MIYYVDIDNTICRTNGNDYYNSIPINEAIDKINLLFECGHTIIYWTSRGQTTGKDWYFFTMKQLRSWDCKFHDLRTDKPSYDFIIDDKCKNI